MSGTCDPRPDQIDAATRWLLDNPPETRMRASTPLLRELFGLSNAQAVAAIRASWAKRYGLEVPNEPAS